MKSSINFATRAVRAGIGTDEAFGAVVPPIHLSANFLFAAPGEPGSYDYTRSGNPTRDLFGEAVAALEGGAGAVVTSSGMSAVALVTQLLTAGDLLLAPHDCYGGCHRLFAAESRRVGFDLLHIDQSLDTSLDTARRLSPRIIWLETPSNPLLRVVDVRRWADVARSCGALLVVDNTFLSPALQRPLELGADIVVHSATKFLNGHSDVVSGVVVARDGGVLERLAWWANATGVTGAPFDSYLALRGLRTLGARMRVHEENALALVDTLTNHPAVARVYHPSLEHHHGHRIAARQQLGWGSILSLELKGGMTAVRTFLSGLTHFSLAESLGGVESLVVHPATMTHASMTAQARNAAGIGEALVRISAGIEDGADLCQDVRSALDLLVEAPCPAA